MADEAFALSPISARAVQPSEEDYAAISEAFMETSRGRWFLTEYAKRNRNADTSMVLDAVARIEASLAAQREENSAAQRDESLAAQKQAAADAAETRLAEALAAISGAVETAQASAIEALDGLALEQKLAPLRKGARVIREISWRLREIGNDGRICDLIDSQLSVIENGAAQISSDETRAALAAAFAAIAERLAEFGDAAPAVAEAPFAAPGVPSHEVAPAAVAEEARASPAPELFEELAAAMAPEPEPALAEQPTAEAAPAEAGAAELAHVTDEAAADAQDEAVLDMIAMEMSAPEPFEVDDTAAMIVEEAHITETPDEPEIIARAPEPIGERAEPPQVEVLPQGRIETAPEAPVQMSLGSTILASGLLARSRAAANDPLAPIRRMSQAEKIAFFS
jgi:hypothetical protein